MRRSGPRAASLADMARMGFGLQTYSTKGNGVALQLNNARTGQAFTFYFKTKQGFENWMNGLNPRPDRISRHFHEEIPTKRVRVKRSKPVFELAQDFGRLIDES